jgi:hypothetical protein
MDGSGGMHPTRFAGGKDRGLAEPDEVRCDLLSRVLIGNTEVRAHAGFRSTGPAGEKGHRRAGHTAQKAATLDGQPVHGNRVPRNEIALWSRSNRSAQEEPPGLPLASIPFHRNAL